MEKSGTLFDGCPQVGEWGLGEGDTESVLAKLASGAKL